MQRFRPLTAKRPKPMLPVGTKPLLEHVVDALEAAGITEIIIVVGHGKECIQNHFGNGDTWYLEITYVTQQYPLGTGHALLQAESMVGEDFLVLNGDRIAEPTLLERLLKWRQRTNHNQLAVTQVEDPTQYGRVELNGEQVISAVEKPSEHAATSQKSTPAYTRSARKSSLPSAIQRPMGNSNWRLRADCSQRCDATVRLSYHKASGPQYRQAT